MARQIGVQIGDLGGWNCRCQSANAVGNSAPKSLLHNRALEATTNNKHQIHIEIGLTAAVPLNSNSTIDNGLTYDEYRSSGHGLWISSSSTPKVIDKHSAFFQGPDLLKTNAAHSGSLDPV
jgi:hypothetical protein